MLNNNNGWGCDISSSDGSFGLESFTDDQMTMNQGGQKAPSNFKPFNIVTDGGINYTTIYVCHCPDDSIPAQQIAIWLASLKETDQVRLTILSLLSDIPPAMVINLMSALTSTKAKLTIQLDQIVYDSLAYFYLIPEKICKGSEGALFIPSYMVHRAEDASGPNRAIHDFFKWMVTEAVGKGILTEDEAERLHRGSHVAVPNNRFK